MFIDVIFFTFFWFPVICLIGYLFEVFLYRKDSGPFRWIIVILTFIGVVVHEISHRVMCALTGVPARGTRVSLRDRTGRISPNGSVTPTHPYQMTFLQNILVSLAPLLFGTWLVYFSLLVSFNSFFDPVIRIFAGFFCISVLLALTPSNADISSFRFTYQDDPRHSLYQVFLLISSFAIVWVIVDSIMLDLPFEFLYYFIIVFCYVILKYTFLGIHIVIVKIQTRKDKQKRKRRSKRLVRRRFKPVITERYYAE